MDSVLSRNRPDIVICKWNSLGTRRLVSIERSTPYHGFFNFNVDGSVKGKQRLAGIGRALRDEKGIIKGLFSKCMGVTDSNTAKILAIAGALLLFPKPQWASTVSLIWKVVLILMDFVSYDINKISFISQKKNFKQ